MVLNKSEVITIPKWLVIVLFPILIGGIAGYATSRFNAGRQEKEIEVTMDASKVNALAIKELKTNELNDLQATKVDRNEFKLVVDQLNRIELKIDKHMNR